MSSEKPPTEGWDAIQRPIGLHRDLSVSGEHRGSPLLEGEGQGEVCELSGDPTHLTPALSFQEREPVAKLPDTSAPIPAGQFPRGCVAGIGFRHATAAEEILALVARVLATQTLPLASLATAADRADEPAIRAVAAALGVPLIGVPAEALVAVDARVVTRSARLMATRGVGSVAEAAALAGAGPGATLLLPRIASAGATCALALPGESVTQAP